MPARHERVGADAVGGPATGELDGEEHVGRLGLPVGEARIVRATVEEEVVEDDGRSAVPAGAHGHDARGAVGSQRVAQPEGQGEVAHVVRGELQLPSERGVGLRRVHDPGVVDEHVQRPVPRRGERLDGPEVHEVELTDADGVVAGGLRDVLRDPSPGLDVADGKRDLRARAGQCAGRLDADPGRRAGDDDRPPAQVDAGRDLRGGGRVVERRGDAGHERLQDRVALLATD
jgi:hypothetical protein